MQISLATLPAKYYWIYEVESKTKPYGLFAFLPLSTTQPVSFRNHQAHHQDLKFGRGSPSSSLATGRTLWFNPAAEIELQRRHLAIPRLET
jgi:hypothetical protein